MAHIIESKMAPLPKFDQFWAAIELLILLHAALLLVAADFECSRLTPAQGAKLLTSYLLRKIKATLSIQ